MQLSSQKLERKYAQKLSNKMRAIENKYQRKIYKREERMEREKQLRTKRLMEQLRKDQIALKTGVRTKTNHEKAKSESTAYADACTLAQLHAKLRDTNNVGYGFCITCKGYRDRDSLQGGHCIAKAKSKATALDHRNINAQCNQCNSTRGGNGRYDVYKLEIDKIRGVGTHEDLLRMKEERKKIYCKEYIIGIIPMIEKRFGNKLFNVSHYKELIEKMKRKYLPPVL